MSSPINRIENLDVTPCDDLPTKRGVRKRFCHALTLCRHPLQEVDDSSPLRLIPNSVRDGVWATVPTGATTVPITITTPGGTITTHASFTVQ